MVKVTGGGGGGVLIYQNLTVSTTNGPFATAWYRGKLLDATVIGEKIRLLCLSSRFEMTLNV